MPTYEEARSIILKSVTTLGVERVALLDSLGRVIADDVIMADHGEEFSDRTRWKVWGNLPPANNYGSYNPGKYYKPLS